MSRREREREMKTNKLRTANKYIIDAYHFVTLVVHTGVQMFTLIEFYTTLCTVWKRENIIPGR